jgi:hypothetical protein
VSAAGVESACCDAESDDDSGSKDVMDVFPDSSRSRNCANEAFDPTTGESDAPSDDASLARRALSNRSIRGTSDLLSILTRRELCLLLERPLIGDGGASPPGSSASSLISCRRFDVVGSGEAV